MTLIGDPGDGRFSLPLRRPIFFVPSGHHVGYLFFGVEQDEPSPPVLPPLDEDMVPLRG